MRTYYDVYFCKRQTEAKVDKHIEMDHKPTKKELKELMVTHEMQMAWYIKRYIYDPCHNCFGAANNDCQTCGYGGTE